MRRGNMVEFRKWDNVSHNDFEVYGIHLGIMLVGEFLIDDRDGFNSVLKLNNHDFNPNMLVEISEAIIGQFGHKSFKILSK